MACCRNSEWWGIHFELAGRTWRDIGHQDGCAFTNRGCVAMRKSLSVCLVASILVGCGQPEATSSADKLMISPPRPVAGLRRAPSKRGKVSDERGRVVDCSINGAPVGSAPMRLKAGDLLELKGELAATDQAFITRPTPGGVVLGVDEDSVLPTGVEWTRLGATVLGEVIIFAESTDSNRALIGGTCTLMTRVSADGRRLAYYARLRVPDERGTWVLVIALRDPERDVSSGPIPNSETVTPSVPVEVLLEVE